MPPENPLGIPEVASIVASYLKGQDLARCVQVSKSWRQLFLPHRWRVVRAGFSIQNPKRKRIISRAGPHPADIHRHRHLIHHLSLLGDSLGLDKFHYPNLRKLTVDHLNAVVDKEREVFLEFTDMFPCLNEVVLRSIKMAPGSWTILSGHSHIKRLELSSMCIEAAHSHSFWEVCSKLESLKLDIFTFKGNWTPMDAIFDHLHTLDISSLNPLDRKAEFRLILQCPALKELTWRELDDESDGTTFRFNGAIPHKHWIHLDRLLIWLSLNDEDVASILGGVGNLGHLELSSCCLKDLSSRALDRHYSTLVDLNIQLCSGIASLIFRDILCSCPSLEILRGDYIFARDVVDGRPWVCQRLRELDLCFLFEESERHLQSEIFRRLSTLVRSQYLTELDKDEVAWMLLHWKKLESVHGILNSDPQLDTRLKKALEALGIKVDVYD
ncbi:hypothetical protein B0O80DRAFT_449798 [Mortierella sp. GBAus27b]|nr:hypothetical protein B0O80DRAFT_449798 [Mortierella sp. GBAus27b]